MADLLAEKVVQSTINSENLQYCPTMDLVALVTADEQTHVFRLNGQRVFGIHNKQSSPKIRRIQWKPNGKDFNLHCLET